MMNFKLYNRNGDRICAAFGCRKHTHLAYVAKDLFCPTHAKEIENIRSRLKNIKEKRKVEKENPELLRKEINLRQKELWLRKKTDRGHYYFLLKLVNKLF